MSGTLEKNPAVIQDSSQGGLDSSQSNMDTIQAALDLTKADKELLELIESNISISQNEMAKMLKWKIGKVKYYIDKLKRKKIIERVGSNQKGYWNILIMRDIQDGNY